MSCIASALDNASNPIEAVGQRIALVTKLSAPQVTVKASEGAIASGPVVSVGRRVDGICDHDCCGWVMVRSLLWEAELGLGGGSWRDCAKAAGAQRSMRVSFLRQRSSVEKAAKLLLACGLGGAARAVFLFRAAGWDLRG